MSVNFSQSMMAPSLFSSCSHSTAPKGCPRMRSSGVMPTRVYSSSEGARSRDLLAEDDTFAIGGSCTGTTTSDCGVELWAVEENDER